MKKVFCLILLLASLTVFSQDSTNTFDYNYKKGMEHYNKGVNVINDNGMVQHTTMYIDSVQKEAKDEFKKAIPYLEKAYAINPKNEKVLSALQGSYFGLYDFEKSDRYKKELESLKK